MTTNGYGHLITGNNEYIKQYLVYDVSGRLTTVYEARANAANADPCLKTVYTYDGSSTRPAKMKESEDVWSSAYDI